MTPAEEWTEHSDDETAPGPDFEPILAPQKKSRRGMWIIVGLIVLLGGSGGAAWHFLADGLLIDGDEKIPLIKAETAPIKVRPATPGGLDVPDRDKLVYDRIEGNGERSVVERLLPPPETPAPLPAPKPQTPEKPVVASPPAKAKPEPVAETPAPPPPPVPDVAQEKPTPSVAEVMNAMRPPPPPPEPKKPEVKPKPVETLTPPKKVAAATPTVPSAPTKTSGVFMVQLAAVRDQAKIDGEWKRLRRKHPDLLGALSLDIMRADLGAAKGVYYRLRAGPLGGEEAARALCKQLTERKVGCLVIRPGG
ncbi:MAG: hypothetical protein HN403_16210 [Rhodospirillales bacterium]|jgi:hypothetical protein|nr:hypothetical protein [Rhodospirillales bacterium]